ncbi:MAG: phosphoribosylformylglycinamidine cyclo-ligase [Desulfobacterales bacterium]|nr:phosphoribosylformylglycinamidine cyclo-ligase [Desulfobacterales bacterium]
MSESDSSRYAEAGVDIDKGNEFVDQVKKIAARTFRRGVLTDIGGFSGLFAIGNDYEDPVLVSSTDGVGTKLNIAKLCNKHDTIGIDLVAMCVNDIAVGGARPLFFLDYLAMGTLETGIGTDIVTGVAKGCEIARCSLIGGETAEMPGLYATGDYDIAGFVVGIAERDKIIDGSEIKVGDRIIGLASTGIHSNGYSLVRQICFKELGLTVDQYVEELGCILGEELLRPTRIYSESILNLIKNYKVSGLVHITGGGLLDNIPRILPQGSRAIIRTESWPVLPIFSFLQDKGNINSREMCRTFNMGIGMVVIVNGDIVEDAMQHLTALGETPYLIGEIVVRGTDEQDAPAVDIDC